MEIKQYSKNDLDYWNQFIKNSKNGIFMFNRGFMDYHSDRFNDNSLMFYDDNELIAVMPMSIHDNELRSHGGLTYGGFITNEKMKQHKILDCFNLLIQYMQEKKKLQGFFINPFRIYIINSHRKKIFMLYIRLMQNCLKLNHRLLFY